MSIIGILNPMYLPACLSSAGSATCRDGTFLVADGYCNSRIVKFSKEGKYLGEAAVKDGMVGLTWENAVRGGGVHSVHGLLVCYQGLGSTMLIQHSQECFNP